MQNIDQIYIILKITQHCKLASSLLPFSKELFFPKQPFHQRIPNNRMITITTAATIPTTAPIDMLLPFSEGAGKSARLLGNGLIRSQHGDGFK